MLRTEPSFSIYSENNGMEGENEVEDFVREKLVTDGQLQRSVTIGDRIETLVSGEFSFGIKETMGLIKEDDHEEEEVKREDFNGFKDLWIEEGSKSTSPICMAAGFGNDNNNGFDSSRSALDDNGDIEEYYKRMVMEDPFNLSFPRNYAQLLEPRGDPCGAEDHYFHTTLTDRKNGSNLIQLAKLVWKLHGDKCRALSYFQHAVQAAPKNSHVLAAYASFLWEINDDDDEEEEEADSSLDNQNKEEGNDGEAVLQNTDLEQENRRVSPSLHLAPGVGVGRINFGDGIHPADWMATDSYNIGNLEEYYKRMAKEDPCNPLFLKNYAQFLSQSKGELQQAEKYYSHAILADPTDGEIISQYAKLIWQLYHEKHKALSYFEQAVHASPEDSNVLAAYARFLWEIADEEEESAPENHNEVPSFQEAVVTANV